MTLEGLIEVGRQAFEGLYTIFAVFALAAFLWWIFIKPYVVEKQKNEKPKRQVVEIGDDGELSEDWELVINPKAMMAGYDRQLGAITVFFTVFVAVRVVKFMFGDGTLEGAGRAIKDVLIIYGVFVAFLVAFWGYSEYRRDRDIMSKIGIQG